MASLSGEDLSDTEFACTLGHLMQEIQ